MYKKLEDIASSNDLPLSNVITNWDMLTSKKMKSYSSSFDANDDLAIINDRNSPYDICREESLKVMERFYQFKKYQENK
jgi:hypothetical protein